jgi:hypothetical protein
MIDCPPGHILRKSYTRRYRNNVAKLGYTRRRKGKVMTIFPKKLEGTQVKSACIKDRGLPGKGPRQGQKSFATLRKGELIKYGYSYLLPDRDRHRALARAMERYGPLNLYHKLDAVAKLSVRTAPDASKVFRKDAEWVRFNYVGKKNAK